MFICSVFHAVLVIRNLFRGTVLACTGLHVQEMVTNQQENKISKHVVLELFIKKLLASLHIWVTSLVTSCDIFRMAFSVGSKLDWPTSRASKAELGARKIYTM